MGLITTLALVAVPGSVGSRSPATVEPPVTTSFREIGLSSLLRGSATAPPTLDPAYRSDGSLESAAILIEPGEVPAAPGDRPTFDQPEARAGVINLNVWRYDPEVSFYGPGFYGRRTACGHAYTTQIMGVAHRSLPCGTRVSFKNPRNGAVITVPVIDRGPYVPGRTWDLSGAACRALGHCWTGPIYWKWG